MTEENRPDVLAREYLDLWQRQVAEMICDPSAASAGVNLFPMLQGAALADEKVAAQWFESAQNAWKEVSAYAPFPTNGPFAWPVAAAAKAGSEAAGDASRDSGDELARLTRRIAELEERLAALEGTADGRGPTVGGENSEPR